MSFIFQQPTRKGLLIFLLYHTYKIRNKYSMFMREGIGALAQVSLLLQLYHICHCYTILFLLRILFFISVCDQPRFSTSAKNVKCPLVHCFSQQCFPQSLGLIITIRHMEIKWVQTSLSIQNVFTVLLILIMLQRHLDNFVLLTLWLGEDRFLSHYDPYTKPAPFRACSHYQR